MKRYTITYENRSGKEIRVVRRAENAQDAIEALMRQYNWWPKRWGLVDTDTRGQVWAEAVADTLDGVTDGFIRIFAEKDETDA